MNCRRLGTVALATGALFTGQAGAVPPVPEESGWSGHINIGVGVGSSESNMLAEIIGQDLGDSVVNSLTGSPDDEDLTVPLLQFEAAYTLADMRLQFYVGNQVVDELSFDLDTTLETHFGVRQELGELGSFDVSLAATSAPTDVWRDPYLVGTQRGNTERTTSGIHLAWDGILSTPFELTYFSREIDLDDERSGQDGDLGLDREEQRALRRTGQQLHVDLSYDWVINERHRLAPGIGYVDYDLDGDAMAMDGFGAHMQYLYTLDRWWVVSKLFYEDLESDEVNPIYGEEREIERFGGSVTVFLEEPFGLTGWTGNASATYFEDDANIDFYDASLGLFSVGMLYRFK